MKRIYKPGNDLISPSAVALVIQRVAVGAGISFGVGNMIKWAQGKKLDDPTQVGTWVEHGMKSGGLGLLSELDGGFRYGHPADPFVGPAIGSVLQAGLDARNPDTIKRNRGIAPGILQVVERNLPAQNIPVPYGNGKNMYDYLGFDWLNETLNPGYTQRRDARMLKQQYLGSRGR